MANQVLSASIQGIDAQHVQVQIDSAPGIYTISIVGMADKAVQESQDRINAAVRNSGLVPPEAKNRRFTVNLAPADIRKEGASFDLPIATAYLLESGQITRPFSGTLLAGELALDGTLAPINGTLAMTLLAKDSGISRIIVPKENASEAAFVSNMEVIGASSLSEVCAHLNGSQLLPAFKNEREQRSSHSADDSFAFIQGQFAAKRALTVAAAGGHNILMKGPPGSGKTLLARAIGGLLPPLSDREIAEVAKIYSSVGLMHGSPAELERPFRSPHHTSSPASLVGGGTWPRPGEISLAHHGVLFLDEIPEFARNVLEALRQPLEDGVITISRAAGSLTLPAQFLLIGAMNPCPCGNWGDPRTTCSCAPAQVIRYGKKISGPLLDRMDIQISVPREAVKSSALTKDEKAFETARSDVSEARRAQSERLNGFTYITNSGISHKDLTRLCPMESGASNLLESIVNKKHLSQRALQKIHKIAQTIADMDKAPVIQEDHVAEAAALRLSD